MHKLVDFRKTCLYDSARQNKAESADEKNGA